jgi:hypothetical protein
MSEPVEILREWTDDHILCCEVQIGDEVIELWWCGWEGLAAAKYAKDSPSAWTDLQEFIRLQKEVDEQP